MLRERSRAVIPASAALIMVTFTATSPMAQSASPLDDASAGRSGARPVFKPIDLDIEAPSTDFMRDVSQVLNDLDNEYRGFKKALLRDYNFQYAMPVSIF